MKKIILSTTSIIHLKRFKSGQQNLVFKVLELISDIQLNPFEGIGKPEPLKENFHGYWFRRVNDEHRLVGWYTR